MLPWSVVGSGPLEEALVSVEMREGSVVAPVQC